MQRAAAVTASLLLGISLAGCGKASDAESSTETAALISEDELFTERDLSGDYDESEAVFITLADGNSTCEGKGVSISDDTITITKKGVYVLSGSLSDGQIVVDAKDEKVQLVLADASVSCTGSAALYVKKADKVFLTLKEGTTNTLTAQGEFAENDDGIDGAIFAKDDLTLNGSGMLTVESAYGHGIVCKDDLKLTGGTYTITAGSTGLSGNDSVRTAGGTVQIAAGEKGIKSDTAIYLVGGDFTIDAEDDAIHSNGTCNITGGNYEISAGDDGVHADSDLVINDGEISIAESYEGLEGQTITVNGGTITLNASDDGLNAAGGNDSSGFGGFGKFGQDAFAADVDCWIVINGGILYVNADGDGIDSNGNLTVTGGEIYVSGPTSSADGALDYNGSASISGGIVVAAGASGMAQNFGEDSAQGSILVTMRSQVSGEVVLADADGNELLSFTPEKSYNSVVVSCPEITEDGTYTVTCGTESTTVEMDGFIYGSDGMMGGGMNPGGMGQGGMGRGDKNSGDKNGQGSDKGQGNMERPDDTDFDPTQQGDMPDGGDFDPSQMGDMPQDGDFDPSQMGDMPQNGTMPEDMDPGSMPQNGTRPDDADSDPTQQ
jgi:hypothetical protein